MEIKIDDAKFSEELCRFSEKLCRFVAKKLIAAITDRNQQTSLFEDPYLKDVDLDDMYEELEDAQVWEALDEEYRKAVAYLVEHWVTIDIETGVIYLDKLNILYDINGDPVAIKNEYGVELIEDSKENAIEEEYQQYMSDVQLWQIEMMRKTVQCLLAEVVIK